MLVWILSIVMALAYARGNFQWLAADAVNTLYTISGLSFQPTALRFYINGQSSTNPENGSTTSHQRTSGGFATSPSSRACVCSQDQDAAATMTCTTGYRTDAVLATVTSTPAFDGMLDLDSIQSSGFKCIVDDATPVDLTVWWEAWGGTSVAAIVSIAEPAVTGNQDYTVTGFDTAGGGDQVVMFFGVQSSSAAGTAERNDSGFTIGFASGGSAGNNVTIVGNNDDGSASSDTDSYGLSGECISMITQSGGNPDARAQLTQFNTNGFRLNWIAKGKTGRNYIALAMKGGQWNVGEFTVNITSTLSTVTVSGLAFSPIGMEFIGVDRTESTAGTSTTIGIIEYGCAASASDQIAISVRNEDGSASAAVALYKNSAAVIGSTNNLGTVNSLVALDAVNSDGFRVIVNNGDAAGSTTQWQGYLAFGNLPSTFSVEMAQGSMPSRPFSFTSLRPQGLQSSQTTHVPAPFNVDMVQGYQPSRPSLYKPPQGINLSQTTHVSIDSSFPEQFGGNRPASPRLPKAQDRDIQVTPPDVVVFSPDMVVGSRPDKPRIPALSRATPTVPPDVSIFSHDMVVGYHPDRMKQLLHPGSIISDHIIFPYDSVEMWKGYMPDRNREFLPLRIGWLSSQPTHVSAPFTPDMVEGWLPSQPRPFIAPKRGDVQAQTTHIEAAFSEEMVQGWQPPKSRAFDPPKRGSSESQTTHVAAALSQDMVAGSHPDTGRQWLPLKVGIQQLPIDIQVLSVEMFQGSHPDLGRQWLPVRVGQQLAVVDIGDFPIDMVVGHHPDRNRQFLPLRVGVQQAAVDVRDFAPDMTRGGQPPSGRLWLPLRTGIQLSVPDIRDYSIDMTRGYQPESGRLWLPLRVGQQAVPVEVQVLSVDMTQGTHPEVKRGWVQPRTIGFTDSQLTHVQASFGQDMVEGSHPDRNRERLLLHTGQYSPYIEVLFFSPEMALGYHPDRNRERLPIRVGWSSNQTTHVAAAFSPEMASGYHPDRNREIRYLRTGHRSLAEFGDLISADMVAGYHPDSGRLWLPLRTGRLAQTPDVIAFSSEMVQGFHPDSGRLWLPVRTGRVSQVPDVAAFSPDMVTGHHPDTRRGFPVHFGSIVDAPNVAEFTVDMVVGYHPDTKQGFPVHFGWTSAQTTHIEAPFSPEMAAGSAPSRHREHLQPHFGLLIVPPDFRSVPPGDIIEGTIVIFRMVAGELVVDTNPQGAITIDRIVTTDVDIDRVISDIIAVLRMKTDGIER